MTWPDDTIWWHVYPLGFGDAPIRQTPTPGHRLRRLIGWLDDAVELGCTGLLLGPVSASQTHGYDGTDQFSIDARLGDDADFDDLVTACRDRDLRILLDGVFSHVGRGHPLVEAALHDGPDSDAARLFDIDWAHPDGPRPRVFEGHDSLVRFDHAGDATADYVAAVMVHWLDRGIDGWRLDAAYSVPEAFWARVLPVVRDKHPQAWFLGEVLHGDYPGIVARAGLDSVTQYELWKAIWSSIKDRNFFELDWSLQRHNDFLRHFRPATFVGNHDVTRIASQVGPELAPIAVTILLTVGGIPSIYYGDERGFTGVKEERFGGDDDVRPAFPDDPADLPRTERWQIHADLIALRRANAWLGGATSRPLELTNTRYVYRVSDGERHLDVDLDLDAGRAVVRGADGRELWHYAGDSSTA
jgi:glycosidase